MNSKEQNGSNEQVLDDNVKKQIEEAVAETEMDVVVEDDSVHIARLDAELAIALQREKETVLRAKAEVENIRRRTAQDIEKAHKFSLEKFTTELLPVIDNLERAVGLIENENENENENQTIQPMVEGVKLTLKSMLDTVSKFGVQVIEETNVPFDPEIHQAMTMLESEEHQPNQVMMLMQKGYRLNGRLLRPAMVAVSKANS